MKNLKNVLILSHERSLNKAEGLIRYFKKNHAHVTLFTDHEPSLFKEYVKLCDQIKISNCFDERIIFQTPIAFDSIFSTSENLLPVQSLLERFFNIENINDDAARILSNKFELSEFCRKIGLENFVPQSVIPTAEVDFHALNGPVITKPDIGTGHNSFFTEFGHLDYRVWNCSMDIYNYLLEQDLLADFLKINREGKKTDRFNNKPCRIMIEEFIPSHIPTLCPCGYYKEGKLLIPFFVQNIKVLENQSLDPLPFDLRSLHQSGLPIGRFGDFAVMTTDTSSVEPLQMQQIHRFLESMLSALNIRELFFSGPDFHFFEGEMKIVDFNPRVGHFFNLLDAANNGLLYENTLGGKNQPLNKSHLLWSTLTGAETTKIDPELLKQMDAKFVVDSVSHDIHIDPPQFRYLQSRPKSPQVIIAGENVSQLLERYKTINNGLC